MKKAERKELRRPRGGGLGLAGLALVALGILLALGRLEVIDAGEVFSRWWPLALVAAGVWWLWVGPRLGGGIALGAGLVLLMATLGVLPGRVGLLVWPLALVIVGTVLIFAALRSVGAPHGAAGSLPVATFSSRQWSGTLDELAGCSLTALFGDARLRLREPEPATPPAAGDAGEDGPVSIFVTAVFGDCEIELPAGWRIRDRVTNVFGAVHTPVAQPSWSEAPVLEVRGIALFGDLSVRHLEG